MAKNLLKYEEKFQSDILKRHYSGKGKRAYFEIDGDIYFTDGYIIYRICNNLINVENICEYAGLENVVKRCEENNTHKLRYNGTNKEGIHAYLTDSNLEVYINPKLLKLFDKPEELELWCDGTNRTPVTVKVFGDTIIGYVMPMRMNR